MSAGHFDPDAVFGALEREAVRYVIIGGLAAVLRGSPLMTSDIDLCPERSPDNLERLARALRSMQARIRTDSVPDGLPFACDARFFEGVQLVNLTTQFGDVDVAFEPSGTRGYSDLVAQAERLEIAPGLAPSVASLEDVIRSKTAANRPKDVAALPTLQTLLAEIGRVARETGPR